MIDMELTGWNDLNMEFPLHFHVNSWVAANPVSSLNRSKHLRKSPVFEFWLRLPEKKKTSFKADHGMPSICTCHPSSRLPRNLHSLLGLVFSLPSLRGAIMRSDVRLLRNPIKPDVNKAAHVWESRYSKATVFTDVSMWRSMKGSWTRDMFWVTSPGLFAPAGIRCFVCYVWLSDAAGRKALLSTHCSLLGCSAAVVEHYYFL